MMENFVNKIINGDCIEVMKTMPENSIDLIVTSPPYGVGIEYDTFDDDLQFEEYRTFSKEWLIEAYRVLKDDGRIALNVPYEQSCKRLVINFIVWSTSMNNHHTEVRQRLGVH